ncbi:MAG TPA: hypothetical protein VF679_07460, partial [Pedobacter sp.]
DLGWLATANYDNMEWDELCSKSLAFKKMCSVNTYSRSVLKRWVAAGKYKVQIGVRTEMTQDLLEAILTS